MISCQNCGADNLIGAIFCRACGAKLKIDEIRPQTIDQSQPKAAEHAKHVAGRIVVIILLVVAAGLLTGIMMPVARPVLGEFTDQEKQATGKNYAALFVPSPRPASYTFNSIQITALINDRLGLDKGEPAKMSFNLVREKLEIYAIAGGKVQVVLKSRILGKIPLYNGLIGNLDMTGTEPQFTITRAQIGRIPLPKILQKSVVDRIAPLFSGNQEIDFIRKNAAKIETDDNQFVITMKAVTPVRRTATQSRK